MRAIMTVPLALLPVPVQDQGGGQHAFCYEQNKVELDLVVSFSVGRGITFLDHTRGRVTVFFCKKLGEGIQNPHLVNS